LSPWKGCAPFCGRSWIVIFNTISGSSAISGKSVLWPCFACGGPKRTTRANAFCNLSMTHLKNDTANYLGLRHSRRAFSFLSLTCRTGIWLSVGAMPAQVLHRPRIWGQSLTLRSDLPLPGDPTGGSIVAPNPLRGMPAGLGYTTTPTPRMGPARLADWSEVRLPNLWWPPARAHPPFARTASRSTASGRQLGVKVERSCGS